jgi:glycosyltransferase involved in cell wall biosynthesis
MTRVLLVCEFASLNGGEHSMLSTVELILSADIELMAAAPGQGPLADEFAKHGINVLPLEFCDEHRVRQPVASLRENLADIIRRCRPDIVHANSLSMSRLLGPVASALDVRSLGHLRDIIKLSRQAVEDINMLDRRLAVSEAVRSYHTAQGMTAKGTEVLYNGVDLEKFQPRARTGCLHRQFGLPPSAALLGTVGQISLRKGHDAMARALRRLHGADAHWLIIGDRYSDKPESRQFEDVLYNLATEGPFAGRIHFTGYRTDMPAVYAELAVLVHPARQEPLGRVLLEAGACGLPIVATDVGGTREIYPPELNAARLVPADDDLALAAAIRDILRDPSLGIKMGLSGRQRIEQAFDRVVAAEQLVRHYRDLLFQ